MHILSPSSLAQAARIDRLRCTAWQYSPSQRSSIARTRFDSLKCAMWILPEISGISPSPRGGIACTTVGTKVVLFGGSDREPSTFDDIWLLETREDAKFEWTRVTPCFTDGCKVMPRSGATLTVIQGKIYLYGGQEPLAEHRFSDIKCLDPDTWQWSDVPAQGAIPPARHSHSAGSLADQCLMIYGGSGVTGALSDVWIFNVAQRAWSHASPSGQAPPAREMHSGCMIDESSMLVYGGRSSDGRILCDAAVLDAGKMKWTSSEPTPFSRCAHSGVPVSVSGVDDGGTSASRSADYVVIYGGFSGDAVEGDVIQIDCKTLEIEQVRRGPRENDAAGTVPQPRFAHASAALPWANGTQQSLPAIPVSSLALSQAVAVIGGVNPSADLNDVAIWVPGRSISSIAE